MKFTKMHGAGNDYVYIDCIHTSLEDPAALAVAMSDRHFGIGSDGLVLILPSESCDFRMRMFNADGSEAQMCGNASRCVGKYLFDKGFTANEVITLETKAGEKTLRLHVENGIVSSVTVDMGAPILEPERIPVAISTPSVLRIPVVVEGESLELTCVSMGNPHAVIFVPDLDAINLPQTGALLEHHPLFPERCNIEFAQILTPTHIRMRVWERGAGETLACGTGACATLVAAVLNQLSQPCATLSLLGGDLSIKWDRTHGSVFMTGGAETVFEGEWLRE